ncbi:peptide ABC transporter permease [Natronococcus pandeyae]|uniref:Peptide ABC transporter permease n=1 Tax=Natronococcus pandeyae TaxID=2055836 RepID=A0A8J8PZT6_9EURY|nr:FtsX-like permease family protein [Natronococcus pandeyae]TYL37856.1 peptide ABC transporter permease [Natronococcus pandeyae]
MSYLRVLVGRWSRRDRLAVLVIALTVALLVGATLLVVAAGDQTSSLADEYDANASVASYDSVNAAQEVAGSDAVVLPMATAASPDGEPRRVVAVPDDTAGLDLPAQPNGTVGPGSESTEWRLEGTDGSRTEPVEPAGTSSGLLPPTWLRTTPDTLEAVGPTDALVVSPATDDAGAGDGTPLVGTLSFFVDGTDDVLEIVWTGVAAAGVIVAVTLSSVVRMTIRDRAPTIRVIRATGAPPRRVRAALAARAGALAAAGGVLGYAIGVIVTNAAVTVAVVVGLPTTLSVQVSPRIAMGLLGILAVLTGVGLVTGYLTARIATAKPPAHVGRDGQPSGSSGLSSRLARDDARSWRRLTPTVLAARTVVPTTATLSTFAVIVLLVASLGAIGASVSTGETTISEPDTSHPVNSQVPAGYAEALAADGVAASPEILLFTSYEEQPYLARGVDYEAFADVTGARLVDGTTPETDGEAAVGVELARTLELEPGDELVVGGSTEEALTAVTVAGTYETGGLEDHQLLVSLPTARHLSTVEPGAVNLVRTEATDRSLASGTNATVVDVDVPSHVRPDETVSVETTVWNPTDDPVDREITATLGASETTRTVELDAHERRTVTIDLEAPAAGEYDLAVGEHGQSVTVADAPPLDLLAFPETAPSGESLQVHVRDTAGSPVESATVAIDDRTAETDAEGMAWLELPTTAGTHDVTVRADDRELNESVQVADDVETNPAADVSVSPDSPSIHTEPTAEIRLTNPWNRTVETHVEIEGPETVHREEVALDPEETTTVTTTLSHQPPGEYPVRVTAADRTLASTEYEVVGDDRLVSAIAASGHQQAGGGLGSAIEYAMGNLQVLLGALTGLAAVTVVGATSAVLARAVRARQRTLAIYRATGASPRRLLGIVVADAIRIGTVAAVGALLVAVAVLEGLAAVGRLTAFGITLASWPTAPVAVGVVGGGIALTLVAALVATVPLLRVSPASLLSPSRANSAGRDDGSPAGRSGESEPHSDDSPVQEPNHNSD